MEGLSAAAVAEWENTAAAGQPTFVATNVADGIYDIGTPARKSPMSSSSRAIRKRPRPACA